MRNVVGVLLAILFFMLPAPLVEAKSYTIDQVQIKGWLQPNGDMVVNEIFTYTFDGEFTQLHRSFPQRHNSQVDTFEAYLLDRNDAVVGEVTNEMLTPAAVTQEGLTRTTAVQAKDQTISVLYIYYLRNAVQSTDTYSDLNLTFFEEGSNHDEDIQNISIAYVLPGAVGESNIHGFMYDRNGGVSHLYEDGIIFETPASEARTLTATRVLFPSSIMTEQQKSAESQSFEKVVAEETQNWEAYQKRLARTPTIKMMVKGGAIFFALLAALFLFMRQRRVVPFGSIDFVLQTDPVYLAYIDRNGAYQSRNFLAGLLSLAEKGHVKIMTEPSAERFKRHPSAPEKTLAFQLVPSTQPLLPHEKTLVAWLFKSGLKNRTFHLQDIAGQAKGEKERKMMYLRRYYTFDKNHRIWHEEVRTLLEEAGTLSNKLPTVLGWITFILTAILMSSAFYVNNPSTWNFVLPAILLAMALAGFRKNRLVPIFYFGVLFFLSREWAPSDLQNATLFLLLSGAIFIGSLSDSLIVSKSGLHAKISIRKFQASLSKGLPSHLSEEDQNRWLARAYLLNKEKRTLPKLNASVLPAVPMATLFALEEDPMQFIRSTWDSMNIPTGGGSSGGTSDYGGGSYSGGGGGDGGGGGAGAD
ncbi:DUF2207 domain-containing protein [Sporosarcina sp. FSL W7-1349]|uniref:DUF2207 domain-containing protein n=1 Tax=Bacillales TaxID=1385 RepID=UPI000581D7AC|nr:DUF2207 domain-containing protein [Bacillus sp. OxB-1]BAQ09258.1 hypothetical protein OXB_0786 [Bacillus sp. OxB-1]